LLSIQHTEAEQNCAVRSFMSLLACSIIRLITSRRMRWTGQVECIRDMRNVYNILIGKPEGKRPLGRSRHRWEDNIKMDLKEILWEVVDWINLAKDRENWWAFVNAVIDPRGMSDTSFTV
jgi:hypothetical protein